MARDLERMAAGLQRFLPDGGRLTRIVPLSTGHSNETYLLEGVERILRMPPSEEGLLPPYDMALQHAALKAVWDYGQGPPVPEVFQLCLDPAVLGDPFFLMQRLDGEAFEYQAPDWVLQAPPAQRARMSRQWIDAVAALHRMPAQRMPAPPQTVEWQIRHWRDMALGAEAPQALVGLLDDLLARPPRPSGPATAVHGDTKPGNCLWHRSGTLLALLDWEMTHVGEPLTDLGYLVQFYDQGKAALASAGLDLPGWLQRAEMVAVWEQATGRTAVDLHRYELLGMCKIAAIIAHGYHLFRSGRVQDPRFEGWGAVVPLYLELILSRAG